MEILVKPREEQDWVNALMELWTHADQKRQAARARWDEAWRIYNNQYDWSGKANWQSRAYIPKLSMTVEMAASLVRRALLDSEDWFRVEGMTESSRARAPYLEKLLYYYLDRMRFADRIIEPLKGGFVGSLIVAKPHLSPYVHKEIEPGVFVPEVSGDPAITVSFPDPYNIWLDPTGRGLFIIEDEVVDMAVAFDLADLGILDGDVLKKIHEDYVDAEREAREEARRQQLPTGGKPRYRREVHLRHFWGSIADPDTGRWMLKNGHFVVANSKYLVRGPMENPYPHKRLPYVIGSPFRRPFSVYHKGLVEDVVGLQKAMTELLNLTLDSALFAGIRAFEVDLDQIEDPQQILSGVYPGKVFTKRGGGQDTRMVREIEIGDISRGLPGVYQMLNTEFQNATAVTEFISGAIGLGGARTATEVVTKQQQGMGIFSEVARNLEGTLLEPVLDQLSYLVVQYHDDFVDPKVAEILGPDLMTQMMVATAQERWDLFDPSALRVRVSGVTALLSRTEEIQRIGSLLMNLSQFGPALPVVMQSIDVPYFFKGLFRKLVRAHGWNESDLIREPGPGQELPAAAPPARGPEPVEGQPAPPSTEQVGAQVEQIRSAVSGGGLPPNGMVQGV